MKGSAVPPASSRQTIPPLPGGVVQHREGVPRCQICGSETVVGRTVDGELVGLTPV